MGHKTRAREIAARVRHADVARARDVLPAEPDGDPRGRARDRLSRCWSSRRAAAAASACCRRKDESELLAVVERSRSMAAAASATPRFISSACSSARAMSSSRCSATSTATRCICSSAIVRCSAATRRSSRRRRAPGIDARRSRARWRTSIAAIMRGDGLRQHRHRRNADGRRRLVQFSRNEHAPAGRARRDRGSDRRRSREGADPFRRRRANSPRSCRSDRGSTAMRSRRASMPKTRRTSFRRPASSRCSARREDKIDPHRDRLRRRPRRDAALRSDDRQGHRARRKRASWQSSELVAALEAFDIQGVEEQHSRGAGDTAFGAVSRGRRAHRAHSGSV